MKQIERTCSTVEMSQGVVSIITNTLLWQMPTYRHKVLQQFDDSVFCALNKSSPLKK